ncbi:hypothetical protein Apa02nite_058390 [Actinoplanes palleronii]|uniref:CcmD family protein n=1 Tax=Actinoplanes palleronii TaxID=113570 RepID=A0ABQ4BHD2_9ACTN|nr:hypothetical protein Apa02nite_058390 [Actinoplanes palleronii]
MFDDYDPAVVLLLTGIWYLLCTGAVLGALYLVVRTAVRDGIKLAAADKTPVRRETA